MCDGPLLYDERTPGYSCVPVGAPMSYKKSKAKKGQMISAGHWQRLSDCNY